MPTSIRAIVALDLLIYAIFAVAIGTADLIVVPGRDLNAPYFLIPAPLRASIWYALAAACIVGAGVGRTPPVWVQHAMVLWPLVKAAAYLAAWISYLTIPELHDPVRAIGWYSATLQAFPALWALRAIIYPRASERRAS